VCTAHLHDPATEPLTSSIIIENHSFLSGNPVGSLLGRPSVVTVDPVAVEVADADVPCPGHAADLLAARDRAVAERNVLLWARCPL